MPAYKETYRLLAKGQLLTENFKSGKSVRRSAYFAEGLNGVVNLALRIKYLANQIETIIRLERSTSKKGDHLGGFY